MAVQHFLLLYVLHLCTNNIFSSSSSFSSSSLLKRLISLNADIIVLIRPLLILPHQNPPPPSSSEPSSSSFFFYFLFPFLVFFSSSSYEIEKFTRPSNSTKLFFGYQEKVLERKVNQCVIYHITHTVPIGLKHLGTGTLNCI